MAARMSVRKGRTAEAGGLPRAGETNAELPEGAAFPYLALDMGAGSGRAFLGTLADNTIQVEEVHRFPNKPVYMNSYFFWDFLYLWEQVLESLRLCSYKGLKQLGGIGIDTWNMDFGLIGENGMLLLNPFSYRDQSAETVMKEISALVRDEELYSLTGLGMNTISALTRLYQLKKRYGVGCFFPPLVPISRFPTSSVSICPETRAERSRFSGDLS